MHDQKRGCFDLSQYVINTAEMGDGGVVGMRAFYESDPGESLQVFDRFVLGAVIENPDGMVLRGIFPNRSEAEFDRIERLVVRNENCDSILHREAE